MKVNIESLAYFWHCFCDIRFERQVLLTNGIHLFDVNQSKPGRGYNPRRMVGRLRGFIS
jgi:hypothetical protein